MFIDENAFDDSEPKPRFHSSSGAKSTSSSRPSTALSKEGERVEANYKSKGRYLAGSITRDRGDSTYDVSYDNGDAEMRVPESNIRFLDISSPRSSVGSPRSNSHFADNKPSYDDIPTIGSQRAPENSASSNQSRARMLALEREKQQKKREQSFQSGGMIRSSQEGGFGGPRDNDGPTTHVTPAIKHFSAPKTFNKDSLEKSDDEEEFTRPATGKNRSEFDDDTRRRFNRDDGLRSSRDDRDRRDRNSERDVRGSGDVDKSSRRLKGDDDDDYVDRNERDRSSRGKNKSSDRLRRDYDDDDEDIPRGTDRNKERDRDSVHSSSRDKEREMRGGDMSPRSKPKETSSPRGQWESASDRDADQRVPRGLGAGADRAAGGGGAASTVSAQVEVSPLNLSDMKKFLCSPIPKANGVVQCSIRRNKNGANKLFPVYSLYLKEGDKFLLASKKRPNNKTSNYLISMSETDLDRDGDSYLGKLRSNFIGTEFQIFDDGENPEDAKHKKDARIRKELAAITYTANLLGTRGPRKMQVAIPTVDENDRPVVFTNGDSNCDILNRIKDKNFRDLAYLINKPPRWNEQVGAYVLNFNGRVTMASVKNFQLVDPDDQNAVVLQFGRVEKDEFTMDLQWPMSPLQAFGITMSSFDSKIACD